MSGHRLAHGLHADAEPLVLVTDDDGLTDEERTERAERYERLATRAPSKASTDAMISRARTRRTIRSA